jgi:hypothetical protein
VARRTPDVPTAAEAGLKGLESAAVAGPAVRSQGNITLE